MLKLKVLVFSGYGLNSEEETAYGFELAGASVDIVHVNDLIDAVADLNNYQILAFPGGFAFGDDTGAGNAYGYTVRNHLWEKLLDFISHDRLIIGICNGFQILVNLGLLPALKMKYGEREAALLANSGARYLNRWTDLRVEHDSPWLHGISELSLPIAHGEGRFYAAESVRNELRRKKRIALKYTKGATSTYLDLPANPNGALDNIAGITDETGRIFGLMPHPDRALFFTQLPDWPLQKELLLRQGKPLSHFGPGLAIFQNAQRYFS